MSYSFSKVSLKYHQIIALRACRNVLSWRMPHQFRGFYQALQLACVSIVVHTACGPEMTAQPEENWAAADGQSSHPSTVWLRAAQDGKVSSGSAVIIAPRVLLTAAHVVTDRSSGQIKGAEGAWVGMGDAPAIDVHPRDIPSARLIGAVVLHPDYDGKVNDLAVLIIGKDQAPFPAATVATVGEIGSEDRFQCDFEAAGYYYHTLASGGIEIGSREISHGCVTPRDYLLNVVVDNYAIQDARAIHDVRVLRGSFLDAVEFDRQWDSLRRRFFVDTEHAHGAVPQYSTASWEADEGYSGGGVYKLPGNALVSITTAGRIALADQRVPLFLSAVDLTLYRPFIDWAIRNADSVIDGTVSEVPPSIGNIRPKDCIPGEDKNWCWSNQFGKTLPSCGELGRNFGWRRLGLSSIDQWDNAKGTHDQRLYCVPHGATEVIEAFNQQIENKVPWYRLDQPQPFTLDEYGTRFPLQCEPTDRECFLDPVYESTWDCEACYLWFGDSFPQ